MRFFSMVAQEVFMAIRPPRPWAGTVYDQSWSAMLPCGVTFIFGPFLAM
jgi:hypothetical protein